MEKNFFHTLSLDTSIERYYFENLAQKHQRAVCGMDEAGRGPFAGPITAAAVIIKPSGIRNQFLQDSKKLTEKERESAYTWLMENSWYGIGIYHARIIDLIGVHEANKQALRRAYAQLIAISPIQPAIILVDAIRINLPSAALLDLDPILTQNDENCPKINPWRKVICFPHAEDLSYSVAAASIIAKVTRDRIIKDLEHVFPGYGLGKHKGYGTAQHRAMLNEIGPTTIHRRSFLQGNRKKRL